jgi:hypothetical protein
MARRRPRPKLASPGIPGADRQPAATDRTQRSPDEFEAVLEVRRSLS